MSYKPERFLNLASIDYKGKSEKEIKALSHAYSGETVSPALIDGAAKVSARIRRTKEAREGLSAFIEKRPPNW